MKLARFTLHGSTRIGVVRGERIVELQQLVPHSPASIREVLAQGPTLLNEIKQALQALSVPGAGVALREVTLEAPIPNPSKYLAIGMNYKDHAEEARKAGIPIPTSQVWFNKQVSCITGPYSPIHLPRVSDRLDYEAELGVVIGKRCRHVRLEDAAGVVGGYFVSNDVTARDWQQRTPTWTLGKSFDTHGPIGPWIVTADEVPDPHALQMRLTVNGEQRQQQSTGLMVYNIWEQIAYLTQVMTLEPGDLIATGTPHGVGIAMQPPQFLKIGDVVRVEITGLGHIENVVIAEPA